MSNCVAFHTQIASIMEVLANAAVAEICKVVDDGYAVLRVEMSQSLKENKALKRKLQMMELRGARGCAEKSSNVTNTRPHGAQSCDKMRTATESHFPGDAGVFGRPLDGQRRDGDAPGVDQDRIPRDECAGVEEGRTESLLIKEERLEEDSDPHGEMDVREERAVGSRAGGGGRPPVQETQNKAENHTEEFTEQHRTRHGVWEVSGPESVLKAEAESESVKTLQHTGCEQSTGRLHSSCPEYLMCQTTSQQRTFFTQGGGEVEAGDPSCSYATETDSESLSFHSELQSLSPTGKGAGSRQSSGSLDVKPEVVMIDSVSTEDEAEVQCAWTKEPMSGNISAQHRHYSDETDRMEIIPGNDDMCPPYAQMTARDHTAAPHIIAPDMSFDKNLAAPKGINSHRVGRREKLFICTYCGKAFNRPKKVEIHQRVHTGEKPFRCTLCGKWFAESGNLKKHQRVHTGEKPFSCTLCGKRFAWIRNLKTHQQRNHAAVCS